MKDSIKALRELEKRLYAYQYAMAVADYDSETVAPPESSTGRAEAMEVLSRAYFDQLVSADTAALLQRAAADAETEQEKAEVRELQRSYDEIGKIPAEEYAAFTKLTQESWPHGVRQSAAMTLPVLPRIWKKLWNPCARRPTILPLTATRMKSGWTAMNTA